MTITPSSTTYEWISLDVWGNPEDGFEVNNMYRSGLFAAIPNNATGAEILQALVSAGILRDVCTVGTVTVEGDEGFMLFEWSEDGMPIGQLWAD